MKPHHHQQQQQQPEPQSRTRIVNKAPTVLAYDTKQGQGGIFSFWNWRPVFILTSCTQTIFCVETLHRWNKTDPPTPHKEETKLSKLNKYYRSMDPEMF